MTHASSGNADVSRNTKILYFFNKETTVHTIFISEERKVKYIGPEIAKPLSHIFNISLESGIFPEMLKQCRKPFGV
jgi:hypothetical protein